MKIEDLRKYGTAAMFQTLLKRIRFSGSFFFFQLDETKTKAWKKYLHYFYSTIQVFVMIGGTSACLADILVKSETLEESMFSSIPTMPMLMLFYKMFYVAIKRKSFVRTLRSWSAGAHYHPLCDEIDDKVIQRTYKICQRMSYVGICGGHFTLFLWTIRPFFFTEIQFIQEGNTTVQVVHRELLLHSWYPWEVVDGFSYTATFIFQTVWCWTVAGMTFSFDVLVCVMMYHVCCQLSMLKKLVKPIVILDSDELAEEDTLVSVDLADTQGVEHSKQSPIKMAVDELCQRLAIYRRVLETEEKEKLVHSLTQYWIERHRNIIRYTDAIQETYGIGVMMNMQITILALTVMAYEASREGGISMNSMSTVVLFSLFLGFASIFCMFGDKLIRESSSLLRAVYDSSWYDTSHELKVFVNVVCQQCQQPLKITGYMFFTLSMEFFGSLLGVVVTYYLFLVQMK